jgi:very-short-patch-repair endonuclease
MTEITRATRSTARQLRAAMTPQERRLWAWLRDLNHRLGLNFRRQAPVGQCIADFVEFGRRLVILVDGGQDGGEGDCMRDDWFRGQGFVVIRFRTSDVAGNPDGVMQMILDALDIGGPTQGGRL